MAITNLDELVANIGIKQIDSVSGAGAISTDLGAPKTYRRTQDGIIITQIKFSVKGLGCSGTAAYIIGIVSTPPDAYIGQYTISDYGVVFYTTLACVESPTQASGTYTTDINIGSDSAALNYGENCNDNVVHNSGTILINESSEDGTPTMTDDDYIFITEGDSAATTGVYGAGHYILTLFGHAVLS